MKITLRGICVGILIGLIAVRVYNDQIDYEIFGFSIVLLSFLADGWGALRPGTREFFAELLFRFVLTFIISTFILWVSSFVFDLHWKQILATAGLAGVIGTFGSMFWGFVHRG